jgi:hypothetical protein
MKRVFNNLYVFWLLLLLPSIPLMIGFVSGSDSAHSLLHPSGENAVRLMILAFADAI